MTKINDVEAEISVGCRGKSVCVKFNIPVSDVIKESLSSLSELSSFGYHVSWENISGYHYFYVFFPETVNPITVAEEIREYLKLSEIYTPPIVDYRPKQQQEKEYDVQLTVGHNGTIHAKFMQAPPQPVKEAIDRLKVMGLKVFWTLANTNAYIQNILYEDSNGAVIAHLTCYLAAAELSVAPIIDFSNIKPVAKTTPLYRRIDRGENEQSQYESPRINWDCSK